MRRNPIYLFDPIPILQAISKSFLGGLDHGIICVGARKTCDRRCDKTSFAEKLLTPLDAKEQQSQITTMHCHHPRPNIEWFGGAHENSDGSTITHLVVNALTTCRAQLLNRSKNCKC